MPSPPRTYEKLCNMRELGRLPSPQQPMAMKQATYAVDLYQIAVELQYHYRSPCTARHYLLWASQKFCIVVRKSRRRERGRYPPKTFAGLLLHWPRCRSKNVKTNNSSRDLSVRRRRDQRPTQAISKVPDHSGLSCKKWYRVRQGQKQGYYSISKTRLKYLLKRNYKPGVFVEISSFCHAVQSERGLHWIINCASQLMPEN